MWNGSNARYEGERTRKIWTNLCEDISLNSEKQYLCKSLDRKLVLSIHYCKQLRLVDHNLISCCWNSMREDECCENFILKRCEINRRTEKLSETIKSPDPHSELHILNFKLSTSFFLFTIDNRQPIFPPTNPPRHHDSKWAVSTAMAKVSLPPRSLTRALPRPG